QVGEGAARCPASDRDRGLAAAVPRFLLPLCCFARTDQRDHRRRFEPAHWQRRSDLDVPGVVHGDRGVYDELPDYEGRPVLLASNAQWWLVGGIARSRAWLSRVAFSRVLPGGG